jgi:hypothetical protein
MYAPSVPRTVSRPWTIVTVALLAGCAAPADPSPATSDRGSPTTTTSALPAASVPAESVAPSSAPTPPPLAWDQLEVAGPPPREDHTWTLAADGTTAYLFGGRDGTTAYGDLWAFDLATDEWSTLAAGDGPAPRFGHEAAWVEDVGLVIFAGQAGTTFFDDLWAFDPVSQTWRALPSAGAAPVARYGTCAAIGPDGRLWISHGFTSDGTRFSDTRAYDFASGTWSDETPNGEVPLIRCLHGCWWTASGELALFGGQTTGVTALDDRWVLGDDGWTRVDGTGPPARNLYARARLEGATLIFGGQSLDGARLDDLWVLLDDGEAAQLTPEGTPPGRSGAEMVVDAGRGRVLLFGGLGTDGVLDDAWALAGDPLQAAP